jgi:hypothetical protein
VKSLGEPARSVLFAHGFEHPIPDSKSHRLPSLCQSSFYGSGFILFRIHILMRAPLWEWVVSFLTFLVSCGMDLHVLKLL